MPNHSENDFRHARKCQTTRETTFVMRGNAKLLGKRLSPGAEMPNHSGNDFRHARKCQTTRKMTFAQRGNAKPFGKRLSPCAEMPNLLRSDLREPRKRQTLFRMSKCYKIMLFLKYYRELFIFHLSPASTNTQMYNLFGLK